MTDEQLLAEIDDLLASMPNPPQAARNPENLPWLGRAAAILSVWAPHEPFLWGLMDRVQSLHDFESVTAVMQLQRWLHQARTDVRLRIPGRTTVAVGRGMTFDYFDEIREFIQVARADVFFVDPYLDADFVSRYLPLVASGVKVRLLGREKIATLLPAADLFARQSQLAIEVRSASSRTLRIAKCSSGRSATTR